MPPKDGKLVVKRVGDMSLIFMYNCSLKMVCLYRYMLEITSLIFLY